jgi:hypothetical protein
VKNLLESINTLGVMLIKQGNKQRDDDIQKVNVNSNGAFFTILLQGEQMLVPIMITGEKPLSKIISYPKYTIALPHITCPGRTTILLVA